MFRNGIRLWGTLLSYMGMIYMGIFVCRHFKEFWLFEQAKGTETQIGFFMVLIIVIFTGLYALFSILTRFAFPIVSLYLICFAFSLHKIIGGREKI